MDDRHRRFGGALAALQAELDWERLGRAYCEGDGTDFFDDARRARWLDAGLWIADALAQALEGRKGPSLYVGAALAEVPAMLVETLVLGRDVTWLNLPGEEVDELARALRRVSETLDVALPAPSLAPVESAPRGAFDHVWIVSVLTDPDHFPALHDELYERHGTNLATGRGSLADDRARADALLAAALRAGAGELLLTTSVEELALVRALAGEDRVEILDARSAGTSAIVGDEVLMCRVRRPGASGA